MEHLEISASIRIEKQKEFNQSKLSFLDDLQQFEGFNGYSENPGPDFQLTLYWDHRSNLEIFLQSELYQIFHGAIITLGRINEILIKSEIQTDF